MSSSQGISLIRAVLLTTVVALTGTAVSSQGTTDADATTAEHFPASTLEGRWTYRSFRNIPEPAGNDPQAWLDLRFAEATFIFTLPSECVIDGEIDWGSGGLDLSGDINTGPDGMIEVSIVGDGRPGTQTEGWRYDYHGWLAKQWPDGVDQTPVLVGSVIRVNPHGAAQAGYVASFIAVKQ